MDLSAEVGFRELDFNWTANVELSQTSLSRQQSPRPLSIRQSMSPVAQPFNVDVFDTRPGFEIMANLPYFRLLSIMEITSMLPVSLLLPFIPAWELNQTLRLYPFVFSDWTAIVDATPRRSSPRGLPARDLEQPVGNFIRLAKA
jgi:hypothetical protein